MKKQISKIVKLTVFAIAVAAALQTSVLGQSDSNARDDRPPGEQTIKGGPLAGVWNANVKISVCATGATLFTFDSMGLFGSDGSFFDTNSQNPAMRSSTFGYWKHVNGNVYQFAMRFFRFSPAGAYLGTQIVRHTIVLSNDAESYESYGTAESYDPAGLFVFGGCSSATATRFR